MNDTYIHFKREHEREALEIPTLSLGYQGCHEPLRITAKDISVYKEIIGDRGTADESV